MTIGAIFIGCFFVSTVSENQVVSGLNTVAYFLAGFVWEYLLPGFSYQQVELRFE